MNRADENRTLMLNQTFLNVCKDILVIHKDWMNQYLESHLQEITSHLEKAIRCGVKELHQMQEAKLKGELAYIQLSFLLSGIYTGENLLKIDFYDQRFYDDSIEIDCFWDYSELFPEHSKQMDLLSAQMRKNAIDVMNYEIRERLPSYRLGQMRLLKEIVVTLLRQESLRQVFKEAETETEIQMMYGVYMGSCQKLHTISILTEEPA